MRKAFFYMRYIGLILILIATAMTGGFFIRRHHERQTQLQIMEDFEARMALALAQTDHSYTGSTQKYHNYLEGETMAILSLERLDIKVSIAEGIGKDTLRISAGHFPGTAKPGDGNFAIAGHSSLVYTCLFNDLHKAIEGDIITVQTTTGTHTYEITDLFTVDPDQVEVLNETGDSIITIVTCTNSGKNRLIIRGKEVEQSAEQNA